MRPGARAIVAVALVAAAGPAGFFAYRALVASHIVRAPAPARVAKSSGGAGSPLAATYTSRIPERLPDITLPDQNGAPRKLSDWRGRPLVVNFWATWCEPCRREIPLLERLRSTHAAEHLEIVGIAVDDRASALKYARALHVDYPILVGGEERGLAAISAFGMADALPFTVFADRQGRILTVKIGELHADGARLILGRLQDVDEGRLTLAAARREISTGLAALAVERARRSRAGSKASGS